MSPDGLMRDSDDQIDEDTGFRPLPMNVEAEAALLGALFLDNRCMEHVSEYLEPQHFALTGHARIYEAMLKLIERGQLADPTTLGPYFKSDDSLEEIGGAKYLAHLAASAINLVNVPEYGRVVYEMHLRRELIVISQHIEHEAYDSDIDKEAIHQIESAEQSLFELATAGEVRGGFEPFKAALLTAVKNADIAHSRDGGLVGVDTGLKDINQLLGGFHRTDLLILAGRPGMGKTALATNIAFNAAKLRQEELARGETEGNGATVGFFSLEMSSDQLAARILSEQAQVSSDKMRKGELTNEEFSRIASVSAVLHELPLFIDDTPALTVSALRTRARRLKRQHDLGMIVVDYLQLLEGSKSSRNDGRVQEVSEVTRGLKALAKELEVPVLALSQLSRNVESREDKRPNLADLRESGSIEQDADVVCFLYRPEYYLQKAEPQERADESQDKFLDRLGRWEEQMAANRGRAEMIVAKQRHGPVGSVDLAFQGEFTRFGNFADLDQGRFHGNSEFT